ncbi:energy transducer TonB [Ferrimonas balearica]|uniref:energy transducer TonB n=1 Tax=Ferrimonas balearica TaxID=44012 RepID=UPI001F2683F6|nr:energy transducer TonB [Ferrimonas balearica]MBY6019436.1 energy transducer TonB [Halomonas denitrificans]MBY6096213.1 energy transducer TonB [Ferrimonas balearica]
MKRTVGGALLGLVIGLSGCQSSEPVYSGEIRPVGYMESAQLWQAKRSERLSAKAKRARQDLMASGGVMFFRYDIDSNGRLQNLQIIRSVPEGLISAEQFQAAQLVAERYQPTSGNEARVPVHVRGRQVHVAGGGVWLPPDEWSDEAVIAHWRSEFQ